MAHYLIGQKRDDLWHITEATADSIPKAIEDMNLESGESVKVWRIASNPRVVSVREEVVRKVDISQTAEHDDV